MGLKKKSRRTSRQSAHDSTADLDKRLRLLENENRRLRHEVELFRSVRDLEEAGSSTNRLLSQFLSKALEVFNASAGTIFLVEPETGDLIFQVVRGRGRSKLRGTHLARGEGVAGWVTKRGRPRLVRDVHRDSGRWKTVAATVGYPTKDVLAVPLFAGAAKPVGVIELLNSKDHGGFRRRDLDDLVAVSALVTQRLVCARLLDESGRRTRQLKLLNKVSHLLNSSLDPKQIRRGTIGAAMTLLHSEAGSLLLSDRDSEQLYFEVALGERVSEVAQVRLEKGQGIAGWVVDHGKPVLIHDCKQDPRWNPGVDRLSRFNTRNMACVPIKVKGRTIGAIQAINKRTGRFDNDDVGLLATLADQVAVALENARLFKELQHAFIATSEALAEAIDLRDVYTGGHTWRVTTYSLAVGRQLGWKKEALQQLRMAAILHDIGKIGVDDTVLRKPGRLDADEMSQMRSHTILGTEILARIQHLTGSLPAIRSHHERYDGLGYPDGLRGRAIPVAARIIAVADAFDAMTSDRPYRKALSKHAAVKEIISLAERQFDPEVVQAFVKAWKSGSLTGRPEKVPCR